MRELRTYMCEEKEENSGERRKGDAKGGLTVNDRKGGLQKVIKTRKRV